MGNYTLNGGQCADLEDEGDLTDVEQFIADYRAQHPLMYLAAA